MTDYHFIKINGAVIKLKKHSGRIPEWQRKRLPRRPGRKAVAAGNTFLAPIAERTEENVNSPTVTRSD